MTLKRILSAPGVIAHTSAHITGSGTMNGKAYHWEFSPMFGPSFTDAEGEILDKQPGPRSNAWKCWQAWYTELSQDSHDSSDLAYAEWCKEQAKKQRPGSGGADHGR